MRVEFAGALGVPEAGEMTFGRLVGRVVAVDPAVERLPDIDWAIMVVGSQSEVAESVPVGKTVYT